MMSDGNEDRSLALIIQGRDALAKAQTIPEVKRIIDIAAAAKVWALKVKASQESVDYATELRLRAERSLGAMLRDSERARGARCKGGTAGGQRPVVEHDDSRSPTLTDLDITRDESSRAQRLAALPPATFEGAVAKGKADGNLSIKRVLTDHRREQKHREIEQAATCDASPATDRLYSVILADPPWQYDNESSATRRASNQYPCMATDKIAAITPPAAESCALYLWTTAPHLPDALHVMAAWGFGYKTCMVWIKDRIGTGWWARERHELLLIGSRGDMPPPLPKGRPDSVIEAPRQEHSVKPEAMHAAIERAFPTAAKIEMFARAPRGGWDRWGLEA